MNYNRTLCYPFLTKLFVNSSREMKLKISKIEMDEMKVVFSKQRSKNMLFSITKNWLQIIIEQADSIMLVKVLLEKPFFLSSRGNIFPSKQ